MTDKPADLSRTQNNAKASLLSHNEHFKQYADYEVKNKKTELNEIILTWVCQSELGSKEKSNTLKLLSAGIDMKILDSHERLITKLQAKTYNDTVSLNRMTESQYNQFYKIKVVLKDFDLEIYKTAMNKVIVIPDRVCTQY